MDKGEIKPVCDGLAEALSELRASGIRLGVVTTDSPPVTELCLKSLGIRELFDFVLTDDGVTPPKPSPASIELVRERLSISRDEVLMVGDTLTDVAFAKAGGVSVVGVAKTERNAVVLRDGGADAVVRDVSCVKEVLAAL